MSTVQVLCPNGRRQNVKITPNTKLLQILEEVCQKQGFLPPEDYKLVHGRKSLDVTLSVRYANIPNNAKLELVKAETSRAEEDVLIALQLENGERLQNKFAPSMSLWEILSHYETSTQSVNLTNVDTSHNPPKQPVCIYMREEVIGELALQATTLRKLGLTGGKAVIRHSQRPVDDGLMAEIIEKLEKEKIKKERLEQVAAKQLSSMKPDTASVVKPTSQATHPVETSKSETNQSETKISSSSQSDTMEVEPIPETKYTETEKNIQQTPLEVDVSQSDTGCDSLNKESNNMTASSANSTGQSEPGRSGQAATSSADSSIERLRALNIPGLQIFTPQDFQELSAEEQRIARRLAAEYMTQVGMVPPSQRLAQDGTRPKKLKSKQSNPRPFADFKFPEETKGQNLYQNELSEVNKEEFRPCDRETVLFDLDEPVTSPTGNQELPDDFFELTENDVKKMMKDLQKTVGDYEEQPLMTQSMKLINLEQKYSIYERVVIRVQFPDKMVLQGLFRPKETVFAITKFVKEYLENKDLSFYLYTSPPKSVLKDQSKSLIEGRLVPASIVYFGSNTTKDRYLSEAVLKEVSKRSKADNVVSSYLSKGGDLQSGAGTAVSGTSTGATGSNGASTSSSSKPKSSQSHSGTGQKDDKTPGVPKWLKIGKK